VKFVRILVAMGVLALVGRAGRHTTAVLYSFTGGGDSLSAVREKFASYCASKKPCDATPKN
jgi:hypothetical protein